MNAKDMNEIAIKDIFKTLYLYENKMTTGQLHFIEGCKKQFARTKQLSEKQFTVLTDIKKHLGANKTEARYTMKIVK